MAQENLQESASQQSVQESDASARGELCLSGVVERVLFYNDMTSYVVFSFFPDSQSTRLVESQLVSSEKGRKKISFVCVGSMPKPRVSDHFRLTGNWITHQKYGQQFAFTQAEEIYPTTMEGITEYLTSGVILGMGKKLAHRIAEHFGENTITILDTNPERLMEVEGLGKKAFKKIKESWIEHTQHRNLALFLQPYGISPSLCARILLEFGCDARERITENPYCLAQKVRGIGFDTADMVAQGLGFTEDHPLRMQAAILAVLEQAADNGNVYLPEHDVHAKVNAFHRLSEEEFAGDLSELLAEGAVVREEIEEGGRILYEKRFYEYESEVARKIRQILGTPKSVEFTDPNAQAEEAVQGFSLKLAPEQREAVRMASDSKMMILTGGPGTGKTTIIRAIIRLFSEQKAVIQLAAPTGRAARRMQEATGYEAKTIHRMLEFGEGGFCARNESNLIKGDVLIIDEASMIDIVLFYRLLKALPTGCTVILVGDVYQLPSVGPGAVLLDLIKSGVVPVVKLTTIFRQSAESAIVRYAHSINQGIIPDFIHDTEKKTDFYFMEENDPEQAAKTIVDLVKRRLPAFYHFPVRDIQVLSPMRLGPVGITALNKDLQQALNPNGYAIKRGQHTYAVNDKVMQLRNNYKKEVFNGDIGTIVGINKADETLSVLYDDQKVEYTFEECEELTIAYAISIHKSQGSEYPAVIIPLMSCHWWMLQRNLLYTGITRGKKLVVLIGERNAFYQAVRNNKTIERLTRLSSRLREEPSDCTFSA